MLVANSFQAPVTLAELLQWYVYAVVVEVAVVAFVGVVVVIVVAVVAFVEIVMTAVLLGLRLQNLIPSFGSTYVSMISNG